MIRVGGTLYAKSGLGDAWTTLGGGATDVTANDNRVAFTDASPTLLAKDGIHGAWFNLTGAVDQYAVG